MTTNRLFPDPVIIIGGGLVGLTLAQALKKVNIAAVVYERDSALERQTGGGWAITIHWALQALKDCLPEALFSRIEKIQVDPEQAIKDTGRFVFLNTATAQPKYEIQPSKRMRVNRRLLRLLLAADLKIYFNKKLTAVSVPPGDTHATVQFSDGTSASSTLVVACDGSNSRMRHLLFGSLPSQDPTISSLYNLPVRAVGATIRMTESQTLPLRSIDPLLFQGCHPDTGVFLWYSVVSTPPLNGSAGTDLPYYEGQVVMSWLHRSPSDDVPPDSESRRQKMRQMAAPLETRLRDAVYSIPEGAEIIEIKLADWPALPWPNSDGRVALAGDAAHAMTMYRGEAFNHGVTDVGSLVKLLVQARESHGAVSVKDAIAEYESELVRRTHDAVLLSRQACLDAHDLNALHAESPLVSKRAKILEPATAVAAKGVNKAELAAA